MVYTEIVSNTLKSLILGKYWVVKGLFKTLKITKSTSRNLTSNIVFVFLF